MTKLQEEMAAVKSAAIDLKDEVDSHAPPWIVAGIDKAVHSEPLRWFFCGMAIEALGITVQFSFGMDTYPILDFVVGILIFFGLWHYQNKGAAKEYAEDDEAEAL